MKACGDLETSAPWETASIRSAVIASPDRWIAGARAAALRFVVWERGRVRSGWIGGSLIVAYGTRRAVVALRGLPLDAADWSACCDETVLRSLAGASPGARIAVAALRHGDTVTVHVRGGAITRVEAPRPGLDWERTHASAL